MSINGGDLKAPLIGRRGGDEEIGGGRSSMDSTATPAVASTGKHSLGFGALVFLIYYNVGVPFGDEEVRSPRVDYNRNPTCGSAHASLIMTTVLLSCCCAALNFRLSHMSDKA